MKMRHYFSTHLNLLLWLLLLLLSACGKPSGEAVAGETPKPVSSGTVLQETPKPVSSATVTGATPRTAPVETIIVTGATPQPGSAEEKFVFGTGPFALPDPRAGLAALSSYKATLTVSFDGTEAGQARRWLTTYVMLYTKEHPARQLTIQTTANNSAGDLLFKAEMDGAAYEWRGDNTCTATVGDPKHPLAERLEPAGGLKVVFGADEAGQETVNGIAAKHYTFDERALLENGLNKSTGEIWVAADEGYVVRYRVTTKGTADYFGKGIEGTLSRVYELTDANRPVTIKLPKDCPPGLVDAPLLPDASNVLKAPSLLRYDTTSSLTGAAAFYQKQIAGLGWVPLGDPDIRETNVFLDFVKGTQRLSVIITPRARGAQVQIILANSQ